MLKQIIWLVLRILIMLLIGAVSGVVGFIVVVNLGFMLAPDFTLNGREGYEATGPIGLVIGALIGLSISGVLLFRERIAK